MRLPPLADPDDYASLIGADSSGLDIASLLDSASAKVRAYCGWIIAPVVTETFTVNGSGTFRQFLPTLNLVAVTSVTDSGTSLTLSKIDWAAEGWLEWAQWGPYSTVSSGLPGYFSRRPRGVVAVVTHGYDETPADVKMLVCTMVARQAASPSGVIREQAGQVSASYSMVAPNVAGGVVLMQNEMADLDAYRIPRLR